MYLLYLDDAGSPPNKSEEYFVIGGIAVFERQAYGLSKQLDEVVREFEPDKPDDVELHASEVFSGREPPWKSLDRAQRIRVLKQVLEVLGQRTDSTCAFACAVHKPSFPGRDPMEIAFEDVCQRFDLFLHRMYRSGDSQRGLIIFDQSAFQGRLRELARTFRTVGTRWRVLKKLAETPLFIESKASRLMQLADHVAYAVFRRYNAGDSSYLDVIAHRFDEDQGRIHGLSHLSKQSNTCSCPACLSRRLSPRQAPSNHVVDDSLDEDS